MEIVIVLVVLTLALVAILAPLRGGREASAEASEAAERAELEAAKEAKLRQIREAELDHRLGKISEDDWRALDASLRAGAIELLREIDAIDASPGLTSSSGDD